MNACAKCGNPVAFCRCWSPSEVAFVVVLTLAGLATTARLWLDVFKAMR